VHQGWREDGITPVIITRQQPADKVIFCNRMVDLYCLGLKDAFANADFPLKQFKRELAHMRNELPEEYSPEFAHELIYGAIEYAARYGFQPHPDFTKQLAISFLLPRMLIRVKIRSSSEGKVSRFILPDRMMTRRRSTRSWIC
jgi:hypothetical protein